MEHGSTYWPSFIAIGLKGALEKDTIDCFSERKDLNFSPDGGGWLTPAEIDI